MAKNEVQFGNWDKEDVEYTTYFEKAAVKGKKGNKTNQNGPQETTPKHSRHTSREESEMRRPVGSPLHSDAVNPKPAVIGSHQQKQGGGGGLRGSDMHHRPRHQHQRQVSREEGDMMMRRPVDNNANQQKSSAQNSPYHRYGGGETTPKRGGVGVGVGTTRQSVGSDRSIEHSPLHLHSQGKAGGGGGGRGTSSSVMSSPSWERKGLAEGLAPSTPGRSRLRSVTKGDDTPDHGPAVPKFGDWDENDPASAEGYTHIFNKVREEKQIGAGGKGPSMPNDRTSYANGRKRTASGTSTVCGCFPWSR